MSPRFLLLASMLVLVSVPMVATATGPCGDTCPRSPQVCTSATSDACAGIACVTVGQFAPHCVTAPPTASPCVDACQPPVHACLAATDPSCGGTVCVSVGSTAPHCENVIISTQRVCREGQPNCPPGELVCYGSLCIMDPCYTTRCTTDDRALALP